MKFKAKGKAEAPVKSKVKAPVKAAVVETPKAVIDTKNYAYEKFRVKSGSGRIRQSRSNGDAVALAMMGLSHDQSVEVMNDNKLGDKLSKYLNTLNHGHFRMLLGASLRGLIKNGETVKIGEHKVSSLTQKIKSDAIVPVASKRNAA